MNTTTTTTHPRRLDLRGLLEAFAAGGDRGPLPTPQDTPVSRTVRLQRSAMCASAAGLVAVAVASVATIWMLIAIGRGTVGVAQPAIAAGAALVGAFALFGADKAFTAVRARLGATAGPPAPTGTVVGSR